MKKILSLVYTLYNPNDFELENIDFVVENASPLAEVILVSDNPEINTLLKRRYDKKNCLVIPAKKNMGQYQIVKEAIKNDLIKTKWFKICDPDDLISIENLKKFNEKFKREKEDLVIRFYPSALLKPGIYKNSDYNENKIDPKFLYNRKMSVLTNENTVHPTRHLKEWDFNALNQTWASDVLRSFASEVREDKKIVNFKDSFYIYNFHNGVSNFESIDEKYVTDLKFFNQMKSYLDIVIEFREDEKMKKVLDKMNTPCFWDYRWAHNYLVTSNLPLEVKINESTEMFNRLKICAKNNLYWKVRWSDKELKKYHKLIKKGKMLK